jgi:hypothetical protein
MEITSNAKGSLSRAREVRSFVNLFIGQTCDIDKKAELV